jgi:hypothetical protein
MIYIPDLEENMALIRDISRCRDRASYTLSSAQDLMHDWINGDRRGLYMNYKDVSLS